ncbi:hypothetical protein CYMTET_9724, partial [Cymbomonas tetramitiformis]
MLANGGKRSWHSVTPSVAGTIRAKTRMATSGEEEIFELRRTATWDDVRKVLQKAFSEIAARAAEPGGDSSFSVRGHGVSIGDIDAGAESSLNEALLFDIIKEADWKSLIRAVPADVTGWVGSGLKHCVNLLSSTPMANE